MEPSMIPTARCSPSIATLGRSPLRQDSDDEAVVPNRFVRGPGAAAARELGAGGREYPSYLPRAPGTQPAATELHLEAGIVGMGCGGQNPRGSGTEDRTEDRAEGLDGDLV